MVGFNLMRWTITLLITSVSVAFAIDHGPILLSIEIIGMDNETSSSSGPNKIPNSTVIIPGLNSNEHRYRYELISDAERNCTPASIGDFPPDFMSENLLLKGGMIVHVLLAMYSCYGLAAICDRFFVPSLQLVSDRFGVTSDVAGATLMAAGTSSPEFFEAIIGAFVTEGDIGVGTIVGSAVFNILAVPCVCGILSGMVVPLDWWPLTRDCAFYTVTVIALVVVIRDDKIFWYESAVLLIMFVLYVVMMYFNPSLSTYFKGRFDSKERGGDASTENEPSAQQPPRLSITTTEVINDTGISIIVDNMILVNSDKSLQLTTTNGLGDPHAILDDKKQDDDWRPLTMPSGSCLKRFGYFIAWPLNMVFYLTIPNCNRKRWKNFYMVTFCLSVVYIGLLSYFLTWMVTILGFRIGVPDTVMGITFLAIGTSVPEAYSSLIVSRKGLGNMAISNTVGSNVFDILFCLGLPWLVKALAFSSTGYVKINSSGMLYSSMSLLATVGILYGIVAVYHFRLNRKVGLVCLITYSAFLIFASLVELNFFGQVNPPVCSTA